jgi:plasmid stabilization system protein ParE
VTVVRWTPEALSELRGVFSYVEPHDAAAALRLIDRLQEAGALLGRRSIGRPGRVPGTREYSVPRTPYILAYETLADTGGDETLWILRVIHSSRSWEPGRWP